MLKGEGRNMKSKLISVIMIAMIALGIVAAFPISRAGSTVIRGISEVTEFGDPVTMPDVGHPEFKVAIVIENVQDLYGLDVQLNWTTKYIKYVDHVFTVPVDDYPDPIPPSPYAGILHSPHMSIKDVVDESDNIPGAELGTMGWWAATSLAPAESFSGNGTVVVLTFRLDYQPFDYEAPNGVDAIIHFVAVTLSDPSGVPIPVFVEDVVIHIWPRKFQYPPVPLVKIMPPEYTAHSLGETFNFSVAIMGDGETDLDPFWDIAGVDIYMHFNNTLLNAIAVYVDPEGWFASFWPSGIFTIASEINNTAGYVHVAFVGIPATGGIHTPPYGQGVLFSVTFNASYINIGYPPPTSLVYLRNPRYYIHRMTLDADAGLIDLTNPTGTDWHAINPEDYGESLTIDEWKDVNGDGKLSPGDDLIIRDKDTGVWHKYEMKDIRATLELTQQPYDAVDDYVWATDAFESDALSNCHLPGRTTAECNPEAYNGYGHPYWTGNFTLTYPFTSVKSITVHALPFTADEYTYTLTEGVDYKVYPDEDKIELLRPLDVDIINEYYILGVNGTPAGWPAIKYVATGIQSVYVRFPNGTERYARNTGFEQPPPGEWWYEPSWPWELESWWATGYFVGNWTWPEGTEYWINYTAASYMTIEYYAEPDPTPYYIEYTGSYDEFLTLGDPNGTSWKGIYPSYAMFDYTIVNWTDTDGNGKLSVGDYITLWTSSMGAISYRVDKIATDIVVDQVRTIDDTDMSSPYYGWEPIVQLAGFPHPERPMSPWHSLDSSVGIPHKVENATYTTPYKVLGAQIDLYTQYPAPHGGQEPGKPSDMFVPQQEVILYAKVTYNLWPEQNKDVSFQVIDPHGDIYFIGCNRTNSDGIAVYHFRLPWLCDNPEYYFGTWTVIATTEVAEQVITDTMQFKYDYLVHIWKTVTDKTEYEHGEYITVTIDYGSAATQTYNVIIGVVAKDETGVPFDWDYATVTVGGAEWCTYANGTVSLTLYVPKWARSGQATIEVTVLSDLPINGGTQLYPTDEAHNTVIHFAIKIPV